MPKVKANNITMNYEQQGAGDPLILIPFLTADKPVTRFKWRNIPSSSPASLSTSEEPGKATNRDVTIRQRFSPTTLHHSCERWGYGRRTSLVYRSEQR